MEQVGTDDEEALGAWRQGRVERRDLFEAVRAPMRQAAKQGIGSITASAPAPHDVDDAVTDAFLELEEAAIATMRIAVVGAGGTGSQVAIYLAYLGFRHVLILDDDLVEASNLNRLITADHADIDSPKTIVARRRMRAIDPSIQVYAMPGLTVTGDHPELHDLDLIVGCVDNDGPRHRLNQIAIETRTPYIDIATGVDDSQKLVALGGRVVFIQPGDPCLTCLDELDSAEIARWAKPADQQALDRLHGYGTGMQNPSVVHLNGLTVNAALAEILAWLSGARRPARWLDIDLLGNVARPGMQIGPREVPDRSIGCIDCGGVSAP